MLLNLQRALVPACLTLGVVLPALPAVADAPVKPVMQASTAHTIVLQHVVPGDVVKMLHWEQPSALPAGVSQIVAVPIRNALLVTATPAGLAKVREIVKLVDIAPRPVQIKFAVASVPEADLKASGINFDLVPLTASDMKQGFIQYADGSVVASFLQTLTSTGSVIEEPDMTTSNDVEASVKRSTTAPPTAYQQFRVTPRINSDSSVTLDLHAAFSEGAVKRGVNALRTIKNGGTLLLVMPPAFIGDKNLLLFVTPTLK